MKVVQNNEHTVSSFICCTRRMPCVNFDLFSYTIYYSIKVYHLIVQLVGTDTFSVTYKRDTYYTDHQADKLLTAPWGSAVTGLFAVL